jgi:hypothetical protein
MNGADMNVLAFLLGTTRTTLAVFTAAIRVSRVAHPSLLVFPVGPLGFDCWTSHDGVFPLVAQVAQPHNVQITLGGVAFVMMRVNVCARAAL